MSEPRFIVPPSPVSPGPQVKSSPSGSLSLRSPRSESKFTIWAKMNKSLTLALCVAFLFVGMVGFVLIANQPVSLFGFQLNPMYNLANVQQPVPVEIPSELPSEPLPGGTGGGSTGTTVTGTAPSGFQVSVRDIGCAEQQAISPTAGPNGSVYTTDTNQKDPDCARINFITPNVASVDTNMSIYSNDFRIGTRLAESESGCTNQIDATVMWTPWASDGGGSSPQARGMASSNDPDCVWVHYEVRPMPAGKAIRDVRAGIASGGNSIRYTNWARQGGGWSQFSTGTTMRPTTVHLEVQVFDVAQLSMAGNFANGTVGQDYSTNLSLMGNPVVPCSWTLISVTPNISGASVLPDSTSSGASAIFRATPTTAGTYQIRARANCQNGQTTEGNFTWVVGGGTTTNNVDISGDFPAGTVGQSYTTNVLITGNPTAPCTWSIASISPSLQGAILVGGSRDDQQFARFTATPTVATTYQVAILANCGNGQTAQKTFPWAVNAGPTTPGTLTITGAMPAGTVNQEYVHTYTASGMVNDECAWTLKGVEPSISGAALGSSNGRFIAKPTVARTYRVNVGLVCGAQNAEATFDWVVNPAGVTPPGPSASACLDPNLLNSLTAIYRFWSPSAGDHLYTTNPNEKPGGYRFEGISGYVYNRQVPGTVAIYRSAQPQIGSHYYTTTDDDPTKYGYVDEGILGYAFAQSTSGSSPWYRLHKGGSTSDYVHTISDAERQAVKELGYEEQGIVAYLCGGSQPTELQPIFRLWSNADTNHFYTTNFAERDSVLTKGYISEGIAGYIYGVRRNGTSPLYRSYSTAMKNHFYSTSEAESLATGFRQEGILGYLSESTSSGTTPFHRLFNPFIGDHFYTTSNAEAEAAARGGYIREGTAGHLFTQTQ